MNKRCLITGVAGFIGSHLAEALTAEGHEVLGLDSFADYYAREVKESNLSGLKDEAAFELVEGDLAGIDLGGLLRGVDWVFHQAAQAGVRASWGDSFRTYTDNNILGAQRLLEAVRQAGSEGNGKVSRIVYASSSSIYGEEARTPEDATPRPISPYGVSRPRRPGPRRTRPPGPSPPTGCPSLPPSIWAISTGSSSACRWFRCVTSRCTAPVSGRTWPSTGSSTPC